MPFGSPALHEPGVGKYVSRTQNPGSAAEHRVTAWWGLAGTSVGPPAQPPAQAGSPRAGCTGARRSRGALINPTSPAGTVLPAPRTHTRRVPQASDSSVLEHWPSKKSPSGEASRCEFIFWEKHATENVRERTMRLQPGAQAGREPVLESNQEI